MAIYAVGDLQGCFASFRKLLRKLDFNSKKDELWLAGDLVNRGPDSLGCLRLAKQLNSKIVLGNHDLHLLACYYSKHSLKKKDTLVKVFLAEDAPELMDWLRKQPLLQVDAERDLVMSHAGLPHIWSVPQAQSYAEEVQSVLTCDNADVYTTYFDEMYGNQPSVWTDGLKGQDRLRVITNYFTRMRFIDKKGVLDLTAKEGVDRAPHGFKPWFAHSCEHDSTVVFGHWAAIEGFTGNAQFQAIDTGCVWGGHLTALNLDTYERVSVRP